MTKKEKLNTISILKQAVSLVCKAANKYIWC